MTFLSLIALSCGLLCLLGALPLCARAGAQSMPCEEELSPAALSTHLRRIAASGHVRGLGTLRGIKRDVRRLRRALRELDALAGERQQALLPGAHWLLDNARMLEEAALALLDDLGGVRGLPLWRHETRIMAFSREYLDHAGLRVEGRSLEEAVKSWQEVRPFWLCELFTLPLALRAALVRRLSQLATECLLAQRQRSAAEAAAQHPTKRMLRHAPDSCAFWEHLLKCLREQGNAEALAYIDRHLDTMDQNAQRIVEIEHMRQAQERQSISCAITSLRDMGRIDWAPLLESLSPVEMLLREDPSAVYERMDADSRSLYRLQVARFAHASPFSETLIARTALECAQSRGNAQDDPLSQHVGFYLLDAGESELWARLGEKPARVRMRLFGQRHAHLLYPLSRVLLSISLFALVCLFRPPILLLLPLLVVSSAGAQELLACYVRRNSVRRPLPSLEFDVLPPTLRTLVVVPTLISSAQQAREMVRHLAVLQKANGDAQFSYMLLADFKDSDAAQEIDDEDITRACTQEIRELGQGETFLYLHRARVWNDAQKRFIGRERKRGALETLNRLILTGEALDAFAAASFAPAWLKDRFAHVITLDSDTIMPPGSALRLVGMIAHPLNAPCERGGRRRGYAVIQPRMEQAAHRVHTHLCRVFGGPGGVDPYVSAVSDVYQDACGRGSFAGKGIYAVQPFVRATAPFIVPGTVLSHDLLEGELAGAALAENEIFYDGQPATLRAYLLRLHRWTRGDWQLLRYLGARIRTSTGRQRNPLDLLSRFKIYDNLRRSLVPVAQGLLFLLGTLTAHIPSLLLALLLPNLGLWLSPSAGNLRLMLVQTALIPQQALTLLDAAVRSLYRSFISHKGLLDWVTAHDAERMASGSERYAFSKICGALLLIFGAARITPFFLALPLGLSWICLPLLARWLDAPTHERIPLSGEEKEALLRYVQKTWAFFERTVTKEEHFLPIDNLQVVPERGAAHRTSPTNIGLYLLSCVAARYLGFLEPDEMASRMEKTVDTLERLEMWKGHLYNWYDTKTLRVLPPAYVSSVDSGNLAACLLCCQQALRADVSRFDPSFRPLAGRLEALFYHMDLKAVYDPAVHLFFVGVNPDAQAPTAMHYDLLASESRLLSFLAVATGQVPRRHWRSLGRPLVKTRKGITLASWSGTMFEYLMPALLMRLTPDTLLHEACVQAVCEQIAACPQTPWGISESGHYQFDPALNYQYHAFGLPQLALRSETERRVIAPYAAALALCVRPHAATKNLMRMQSLGWLGELGFYEAADYTVQEDGACQLVQSHMAHHQGMALCAMCNVLMDDVLVRLFSGRLDVSAYSLLLEERIPERRSLSFHRRAFRHADRPNPKSPLASRKADIDASPLDVQVLYGEGTTLVCDARGGGYLKNGGFMLSRFRPNPLSTGYGPQFYVAEGERTFLANRVQADGEVRFETGRAVYSRSVRDLKTTLSCCVGPLDGTAIHLLEIENTGRSSRSLRISSFMEVALCSQRQDEAHPAFAKLFVQTRVPAPATLIASRRAREPQEHTPTLFHTAACSRPGVSFVEISDRDAFLGRGKEALSRPQAMLPGVPKRSEGAVVDPCVALLADVTLAPEETLTLAYATGVQPDEHAAAACAAQYAAVEACARALSLARIQAQVSADYLGLDPGAQNLISRAATYAIYDGQNPMQRAFAAKNTLAREEIWAMGISGDLPIVTVRIANEAQHALACMALKMHEVWRQWGVWTDLIFLCPGKGDYGEPVREMLLEQIACGHARDLVRKPGGVYLVEQGSVSEAHQALLLAMTALYLDGDAGSLGAQLKQLRGVLPARERFKPHPRGSLDPLALPWFNGYGGFDQDGAFVVECARATPAPWCNILANAGLGCIVTERSVDMLYAQNSHDGRLTAFTNDPVADRSGQRFFLIDEAQSRIAPMPQDALRARYQPGSADWEIVFLDAKQTFSLFVDRDMPVQYAGLTIRNQTGREARLCVGMAVDFILDTTQNRQSLIRVERNGDALLLESPCMPGVTFAAALSPEGATQIVGRPGDFPDARYFPSTEHIPFEPNALLVLRDTLRDAQERTYGFCIGHADSVEDAHNLLQHVRSRPFAERRQDAIDRWNDRLGRLALRTPDAAMNAVLGRWLPYQTTASRLYARAGFYQAGGAIGFRDQLQDMLVLLYTDPDSVRDHLLLCAAHQFEDGDVQHWWHPPARGVRTRMTDDLLFLPFMTATYVTATDDRSVLAEEIPYLQNVEIPDGQEDYYGEALPTAEKASLTDHCLRAIERVSLGEHGIPLIGTGDWNDAMSRVGIEGKGESIWLGWFYSVTARFFASLCAPERQDALLRLADEVLRATDEHGWDGGWYRRAYMDDGTPLGSALGDVCRIDCIAQCWAVLAGAPEKRANLAMDALLSQLVDRELGIVRLLAPAFDDTKLEPGYIKGYLPGVRENGGQYTHGAAWAVLALRKLGRIQEAWEIFRMLLPYTHSESEQAANRYRVEPYVSAADIYANAQQPGRGGWTWYTGSAAWIYVAGIYVLLGFEKQGERIRLKPTLPADWEAFEIVYRHESSTYVLRADRHAGEISLDGKPNPDGWITLTQDGAQHEAVFPALSGAGL